VKKAWLRGVLPALANTAQKVRGAGRGDAGMICAGIQLAANKTDQWCRGGGGGRVDYYVWEKSGATRENARVQKRQASLQGEATVKRKLRRRAEYQGWGGGGGRGLVGGDPVGGTFFRLNFLGVAAK